MDNSEEQNEDENFSAKEVAVPHQLEPDPFCDLSKLNESDDESTIPVTESNLVSVVGGYYYSASLTSKGEVYTWGSGEFGRLGYVESKKTP